jgi:hypothetical protein
MMNIWGSSRRVNVAYAELPTLVERILDVTLRLGELFDVLRFQVLV